MKKIELQRRLALEEYIMGGIRPIAKTYQAMFQKVKDIKAEIEFLEIQIRSKKKRNIENQIVKQKKMNNTLQIAALPLDAADRMKFIRTANSSFEMVFDRIEPENPELVRRKWDAEKFINEDVLTPDRLSIDRNYALSLINAIMVDHVIQLAFEADS